MGRPEAGGTSSRTGELQLRYRGLRRLLAANSEMLEWMADLEADLHHLHPGEHQIRQPVKRLLEGSLLLAENLNVLTGRRFEALYDAHRTIETAVRKYLSSFPPPSALPLMVPLRESSLARVRETGGKAAHLGELRMLMPDAVAQGFTITTAAYRLFIEENNLHGQLRTLLKDLSLVTGRELFKERLQAARVLITASPVPRKVAEAIADGVVGFALPWPSRWAVRSSAVGEDGRMSFAGQFDSVLNVPTDGLRESYKRVIASRFTERAVLYRLIGGFTEVDTPMAVLFLPMIEARSAGVLYTRDPGDEAADGMIISSVWGLADGLVQGEAAADTFVASRSRPGEIVEQRLAALAGVDGAAGPSLTPGEVKLLVETGLRIEEHYGRPQDIEWVLTPGGKLMIVQSRRLRTEERRLHGGQSVESRAPLLEGGVTIFPGRAVGPAFVAGGNGEVGRAGEGAVLVVRQATPELGAVLPSLAGVIAEQGSPSGHAATLLREFGIPAVFGMEGALKMKSGQVISLDATHRRAYEGELWPEVRERVKARIAQGRSGRPESPLQDLVLTLNLTDPLAMSFRAKGCKSVHDIVRFTHEQAVAAMFELGDEAGGRSRRSARRLESPLALNIHVLDLGGSLPEKAAGKRGTVRPEEIRSVPFQALWLGIHDPAVSWAGRTRVSGAGFMSVMAASVADRGASVRGLGGKNYLMVAPEYVNFNARLAYHFAMVDALVGEVPENNYVNFRFRGGGAGRDRRSLRAEFLTRVLRQEGFAVDRRGDLVTAWLSRYPREASEAALALLGRLMGCARQLDMLLDSEAAVNHYVERFRAGDYGAFA